MSDLHCELEDWNALDELVYRSMCSMDACNWTAYRRELTDDAIFDFGDDGAAAEDSAEPAIGGYNFVAVLSSVMDGFDATQHVVTNMFHSIEGDAAKTNCYVVAEHFLNSDHGGRDIASGSHCEIDSVRASDGWKISRLQFRTYWYRGNTSLYQLAAERVAAQCDV